MPRRKNINLKSPNETHAYEFDQLQELERCSTDPLHFIPNYCYIQHPIKGLILFDLYDYQQEMIKLYMTERYTVVLAARQSGKALDIKTPIATPSGWTTMGEIEPGDQVFGSDGSVVNVIAISNIEYDRECYEIEFSNGEFIVVDSEHLWEVEDLDISKRDRRSTRVYTKRPERKKIRLPTKVLTTNEIVKNYGRLNSRGYFEAKYAIKTCQPLNLSQKELLIDPYVLGMWLGDGTSATGSFTCHKDDYSHYKQILEQLGHRVASGHLNKTNTTLSHITIYKLHTALRQLNLLNNKHIPVEYLRSSYAQRLNLLQGLMDTDGSVSKGNCEFATSNIELVSSVHDLICGLGLKPTIRVKLTTHKPSYSFLFTPFKDRIQVFRLQRKLEGQKQTPDEFRCEVTKKRCIRNIKRADSVPVKCISVDSLDNLYLAGRAMIPTHNSTTTVGFLYWFASFNFGKTVLIVANKNDLAMEMIMRIRLMYEMTPRWLKPGVLEDGWNKHGVAFDNQSRIISVATAEDSGRGLAVSMLYADEFAFVKPHIQEDFWSSISPTLATGGQCIMSSTPNGNNNLFSGIWRKALTGLNDFKPFRVKWDQPPGRDEEFKRTEIGRIGEHRWRQEYECEFLSSEKLLIKSIVLHDLEKDVSPPKVVTPKFEFEFWKPLKSHTTYLVGVDPSTGSGEDYSVIQIVEFPAFEQVGMFRSNNVSSPYLYTALKTLLLQIEKVGSKVYFSVENNGVGEGVISLYEADEKPPMQAEFISEQGKKRIGMTTTSHKKMVACLMLKEMIESKTLKIKSPIFLDELKSYIRKGKVFEAQRGSSDDTVSAMLIVMRLIDEISTYEDAAFSVLYQVRGQSDHAEDDDPLPVAVG